MMTLPPSIARNSNFGAIVEADLPAAGHTLSGVQGALTPRSKPGCELLSHLVQQRFGLSNPRRGEALCELIIYRGEH